MEFDTKGYDNTIQPFTEEDYYQEPSLGEVASAAWNTTRATELSNSRDFTYSNTIENKLKDIASQDPDNSYSYEAFTNAIQGRREDFIEMADKGDFYLDENDKVVSKQFAHSLMLDFADSYDITRGYLLAKKRGVDFSGLDNEVIENTREQVKKSRATLENSTGFVSGAVEFGASVAANITDPVNIALIPFGMGTAVGKGIAGNALSAAGREAGLNAIAETITQPQVYSWKQELGLDYEVEDAVMNIAAATFGGLMLGAGGSFVVDAGVVGKAMKGDTTLAQGKEIFERWDNLQAMSLTKDTTKNLDLMRKANQDMIEGTEVEVSQALKDNGDMPLADGPTFKDYDDLQRVESGEKALDNEMELLYREGTDDIPENEINEVFEVKKPTGEIVEPTPIEQPTAKIQQEADEMFGGDLKDDILRDMDDETLLEYNTIKKEDKILAELFKCQQA